MGGGGRCQNNPTHNTQQMCSNVPAHERLEARPAGVQPGARLTGNGSLRLERKKHTRF